MNTDERRAIAALKSLLGDSPQVEKIGKDWALGREDHCKGAEESIQELFWFVVEYISKAGLSRQTDKQTKLPALKEKGCKHTNTVKLATKGVPK